MTDFALNPTCHYPIIVGKKSSDKWFVYFNYYVGSNHPLERHRVYSKSEVAKIILYCDDKNDMIMKTVIYLVYGAQIRISEILKIQIRDFRIHENKIILRKGKAKVKNKQDYPLR